MAKPTCVTKSAAVDKGTQCMQRSPVPGNTGVDLKAEKERKAHEKQVARLAENEELLKNTNVKAFLESIAAAEGGDYDLKYGGVKGKKNDKWRITDFSTHPGTGSDGKTTAAGMYQINKGSWKVWCAAMGLTDFSPKTQDLLAVEALRGIKAMDAIVAGDVDSALSKASQPWAALPQGPGKPGRYDQPYMKYEKFIEFYTSHGGIKR